MPRAVLAILATALAASAAVAEEGELDLTFGAAGRVVTDFGPTALTWATSLVVQPDGRIVAAGRDAADFALARYLADGSLDPGFGSGGRVTTDFAGGPDGVQSLALLPDGRLVAAGSASGATFTDVALARYQADGSLDPTFGVGGRVVTDLPAPAGASDLVVQPDGKLLVASLAGADMAVLRYLPDGTPDPSFDGDGLAQINSDVIEGPNALLLQADGKVVVVGFAANGLGPSAIQRTAVVRLAADGSVDAGFGTSGVAYVEHFLPRSAVLLADGAIVGGGFRDVGGENFSLFRLTADGDLDPGFGLDGVLPSYMLHHGSVHALLAEPDGGVVAVGEIRPSGGTPDFALVRYQGDGTLDTGFARCVPTITPFGPPDDSTVDRPFALARQPDGRLVAAGVTTLPGGTTAFALARYGTPALPACVAAAPGGAKIAVHKVRARASWRWRSGVPLSPAIFGDPGAATDLRFCAFDVAGAPIAFATVRGGATLGGAPLWEPTAKGFRYREPTGNADGLRALVLAAPPAGPARLRLRAGGSRLRTWFSPASPAVTTRLVRDDDHSCFEATFSTASRNDGVAFRAVSD